MLPIYLRSATVVPQGYSSGIHEVNYIPIAFDEKVTYWLQRSHCLVRVCLLHFMDGGDRVMVIREPHTQIMQHAHTRQ